MCPHKDLYTNVHSSFTKIEKTGEKKKQILVHPYNKIFYCSAIKRASYGYTQKYGWIYFNVLMNERS